MTAQAQLQRKLTMGAAALLTTLCDEDVAAPEGILYAAMMAQYSYSEFTAIVEVLVAAGHLRREPGSCLALTEQGEAVACACQQALAC